MTRPRRDDPVHAGKTGRFLEQRAVRTGLPLGLGLAVVEPPGPSHRAEVEALVQLAAAHVAMRQVGLPFL